MSVLDRYLNTEKYQGVMRGLTIAQILNEKTKPGLFIKQNALNRCGFTDVPMTSLTRPITSTSSTPETPKRECSSRRPGC